MKASATVAVPVFDAADAGERTGAARSSTFRSFRSSILVLVSLATLGLLAAAATSFNAASKATPNPTLSQSDSYSNDRCIVYTYFEDQGMGHGATVEMWKTLWANAGWKPVVLSEEHASAHPDYDDMKARFATFPTTNPTGYEVACYLRYLAMAVVGGGFMSDYDVANVNVPPPPRCDWLPNEGRLTTHEEYTPAVMSGSGEEYERVVRAMYDADIDAVMAADDASMVSDMFFLQYFRDQGLIWTTPALFTMANWVSDPPCDDEGVELPMLFHFSTANTHYELKLRDFAQTRYELYDDDKPSAMNASVTELNEKRKRCSPLPRESDAEYQASYFAPPGTNAFRDAMFKYRQCFIQEMYPQTDCAEAEAPAAELLRAARDADGNAAAVKEHGGHEESDLFGGGAGIESEEGWNSKAV